MFLKIFKYFLYLYNLNVARPSRLCPFAQQRLFIYDSSETLKLHYVFCFSTGSFFNAGLFELGFLLKFTNSQFAKLLICHKLVYTTFIRYCK
jgi:hypothetical protein